MDRNSTDTGSAHWANFTAFSRPSPALWVSRKARVPMLGGQRWRRETQDGESQLGSTAENRGFQVLLLALVWGLLTLETRLHIGGTCIYRHRGEDPPNRLNQNLGLGTRKGFPFPFHGKD